MMKTSLSRHFRVLVAQVIFVCLTLAAFCNAVNAQRPNDTPQPEPIVPIREEGSGTLTGRFSILWSDSREGESQVHFFITPEGDQAIPLHFGDRLPLPYEDLLSLRGQLVTVLGAPAGSSEPQDSIAVTDILPAGETISVPSMLGNQPWVSILCKFADIATEPKPPSYFQTMYSSAYPGLDHYWREQSYGLMNLAGSSATQLWYALPQPRSYYVYDYNGDGVPDFDYSRAETDCTAVADAEIYFPAYAGINMMFNAELQGVATPGMAHLTLDGVTRYWYTTNEPPWGYSNIAVIAHEMGHAFGLPHSSGSYGRTYDNPWDVMSDTWSNCSRSSDPTYGCLGQHTISYHKNLLGWIAPERKHVVPLSGQITLTMEQLALPGTSGYLLAEIPINGSTAHYYTVEARHRIGYDVVLPGEAVIIHEVVGGADSAHVVDVDRNGDSGDAGAQWLPGETFIDAAAGITVTVDSMTASSFVVSIQNAGGIRSIVVNTTAQKPGAVGDCTLGEAIDAANADAPVDGCQAGPGSERILLPAGTYILSAADNSQDGGNGLPVITTHIVLEGAGRDITLIQRAADAPSFRMLDIDGGGSLLASGITLSGGEAGGTYREGGAIYNWGGSVELNAVRVSGNRAKHGGGIYSSGSTRLIDCLVEENTSSQDGGGIHYYNWHLTLMTTTVRNNTSGGLGGGLASRVGIFGSTTIISSTFTGNSKSAIYAPSVGPLNIIGSTIRGNSQGWAGGVACWYCALNIQDTLVKQNAGGIYVSSDQAARVNNACIEGNSGTAISISATSPALDATNNWWGAANGPSGAGSGNGDVVGTDIDFVPFLMTRPDSCEMAPNLPTSLTSPSHTVNAWSNDSTVDVTWTAASDDDGLDGYSVAWDHAAATVPHATKDIGAVTAATSPVLADGDWYLHIRPVDQSGNWAAAAAHLGPFRIDTTPPTSMAHAPRYAIAAFPVTWAGSDGGSGIASYDVWMRIGGAGGWTKWQTATTGTVVKYTGGTTGDTVYFRSQARDRASNVETDLLADGDALTTLAAMQVSGQVVNNRHQPVFNTAVSATPALLNSAVTDGHGRYTLFGAATGVHDLTAGRAGYRVLPPMHGVQVNGNLSGVDFVLPPEENAVVNGDWEAGDLTGWQAAPGAAVIVEASAAHTGLAGLRLGSPTASALDTDPLWQITQTVTPPAGLTNPTLSWLYRVNDGLITDSLVIEVSAGASAITRTIPLAENGWTHAWEDLSALDGQTVTLRIGYFGTAHHDVFLDEVSIGSTYKGSYPAYLPLILQK